MAFNPSFNPLQNFQQGFQSGQQTKLAGLRGRVAEAAKLQGFDPTTNLDFQQWSVMDPSSAAQMAETFESLDSKKKKRYFNDMRQGRQLLEANDKEGFFNLFSKRLNTIEKQGGDSAGTKMILDRFAKGDYEGIINGLKSAELAGIEGGFLTDPLDRQLKKAQIRAAKTRAGQPAFAPDSAEKKEKRLMALEAQLATAKKTGDQKSIEAAQSQLTQFRKLVNLDELTPQQKADIEVEKASKIELVKYAAKASSEAFTGLKAVRSTILNIGDAIRALDKGADTGPIISKLPSFREASIELDNIRQRMGLDVVGSTTFGALSESELAFALDTALPDNLQPKALKAWLQRKKKAQTKLATGLRDAASFLGKPGNTIADFIEKQELKAVSGDADSGLTPEEAEELRRLEQQFGDQ